MQFVQMVFNRTYFRVGLFSVIIVIFFLLTLSSAHGSDLQFVDKTMETGLSYPLSPSYGVSWGDFNNDSLVDIHIRNHYDLPSLYQNLGNGGFADVTGSAGLFYSEDLHGTTWGDFDNDGDLDLYQVLGATGGHGTKTNYLFQNDGNGFFVDIAGAVGLQDPLGRGRTPVWFDYDNDGRLDLFIANEYRVEAPSRLFRNDESESFVDVTESAGLGGINKATGTYVADIDGDGLMDLLLSKFEGVTFYSNNGDGTFEDITDKAGLSNVILVNDLALGDYDNDGDVDIFVCRGYDDWLQDAYEITSDRLYHRGKTQDFEKGFDFEIHNSSVVEFDFYVYNKQAETTAVYIGPGKYHPEELPFSLDDTATENHGEPIRTDPGVYIWLDVSDNRWHIRYSAGSSSQSVLIGATASTSGSFSQVNPVGLEMPLTNVNNQLFENSGMGQFLEITDEAALGLNFGDCRSALFADFDNDGDLDIYAVYTGGIFNEANKLYENDGQGRFADAAASAGAQAVVDGRGESVAAADYNSDGLVDLIILNGLGNAPFHLGQRVLLENQSPNNNWIQLKLIGNVSNRDAVGTKVNLKAGALNLMRQQTGGMHRASQNSQILQFGLANQTTVNEILVHWPSGVGQRMTNIASDQRLEIEEPEPVVSLDLVPDRSTVRRGEVVGIRVTATNLTGRYQGFLFGTNISLADGDMYPTPPDFLFGPKWVRLAPYATRTVAIKHEIPADAPTGVYIYNGAAGRKPWRVWYEDHFKFAVLPSS